MASRKIVFATKQEWLAARRQLVTATDVSAILGMNPDRSAFAVWAEKVGRELPQDLDLDDPKNEHIKWGALLEEPIAMEIGRRLDREMIDHGRWTLHVNDELPVPIAASLDREIGVYSAQREARWLRDAIEARAGGVTLPKLLAEPDPRGPGAAEIKTFGTFADPSGAWEEEGPIKHIVQLQVQMAVTVFKWGVLGGLGSGQRLRIHLHERDDEFISWMLGKVEAFWTLVRSGTPPPVDGTESTATALSTLYRGGGAAIELPAAAHLWHEQWYEARQIIAAAERDEREASSAIKLALGDAEEGVLPAWVVGKSGSAEVLRQGFRWKRIQPKPSVCEGCGRETPVTPYRRFTGFAVKPKQ